MHTADRELLDHFLRTRERTIELMQNIPDELLTRTPDGEAQPLYHLLAHAGCSGEWKFPHIFDDGLPDRYVHPSEKTGLLAEVAYWRDRVYAFFNAEDGANLDRRFHFDEADGTHFEWTGRNRLLYLIDHEVHHRGKIVLALRQWGMEGFPFFPF